MTNHIAYYRVSTDKQGKSGLGLEAQKEAVRAFLGGEPSQEFIEIESGRRASRPKLLEALEAAKVAKATLIVAKLDRLARNARFLLQIVESGTDVVFCDLPDIPTGPTGKFMLTMLAAVAELESGMISERTKAALQAAKKRGTKLGTAGKDRARENKEKAVRFAREIAPNIIMVKNDGAITNREIAEALNARGIPTQAGAIWHPTTVQRVIQRLEN